MATTVQYLALSPVRPVQLRCRLPRIVSSSDLRLSSRNVLEEVDEKLARGDERSALLLVKDQQGKPGGVRCFGAARQVPERLYSLDELKLNGIETASLLSPVDGTLGAIERNLQLASLVAGISAYNVFGSSPHDIFYASLVVLFLWTLDSVSFNGGFSSLILDTIGHTHEAGHFLVAYLMGILPKQYTLSSLEAFQKEGSLNVQAGTAFVDVELVEEVNAGKVTATMLNKFSCVALAGVATEYLLYGQAEGGLADIKQLDAFLTSLGFTQKKADSQVRWAVLNTILILRRHEVVRGKLSKAMSQRKSIGRCIHVIEESVDPDNI
ncbi:unnamed protein product [Rhodiola kirilowii]